MSEENSLAQQLYEEQRALVSLVYSTLEDNKRALTPPELVDNPDVSLNLVLKNLVVLAEWEDIDSGAKWISHLDGTGIEGDDRVAEWTQLGLFEYAKNNFHRGY